MIELSTPAIRSTILVVDDNLLNIEVIYEMLTPSYEVLFATSGLEALELTVATNPDLILLDVMMPGLNGYEVCRHLKMDVVTQHIPIIFITAAGQTDSEVQGFSTLEYVASRLSMSERTLKRHLAKHNITYSDLVDEARKQKALDLVADSQRNLDDISEYLGYSDMANFTRAFKRWTGHTPSAYRKL